MFWSGIDRKIFPAKLKQYTEYCILLISSTTCIFKYLALNSTKIATKLTLAIYTRCFLLLFYNLFDKLKIHTLANRSKNFKHLRSTKSILCVQVTFYYRSKYPSTDQINFLFCPWRYTWHGKIRSTFKRCLSIC